MRACPGLRLRPGFGFITQPGGNRAGDHPHMGGSAVAVEARAAADSAVGAGGVGGGGGAGAGGPRARRQRYRDRRQLRGGGFIISARGNDCGGGDPRVGGSAVAVDA